MQAAPSYISIPGGIPGIMSWASWTLLDICFWENGNHLLHCDLCHTLHQISKAQIANLHVNERAIMASYKSFGLPIIMSPVIILKVFTVTININAKSDLNNTFFGNGFKQQSGNIGSTPSPIKILIQQSNYHPIAFPNYLAHWINGWNNMVGNTCFLT